MEEIAKLTSTATMQEVINKINELVDAVNKDLHGIVNDN